MSYSFKTSDVPLPDRFDYFQVAAAESYIRCELSTPAGRDFFAEIDLKPIDDLKLSFIQTNSLHADIPRPKRETSVPDIAFLMFVTHGCANITQDGREVATRAGEMCLLDTARPYSVGQPQGAKQYVLEMPRLELESRIGSLHNVTGRRFSAGSTEGVLAAGYLSKLFANPHPLNADAAPSLARQALDVAALALGNGSTDVVKRLSSPAAITRLRLHHAIDSSLGEGHVSCEDVASMAGISMRYANLLLAQEGTSLERLLIQKRLERCRDMLADPQLQHHLIGDIALAAGFGSASHFARSFKETFGITAREFRNEAGHLGALHDGLPNLRQYLAPEA
jgi:AraC family transcriptional activator of tynA and feaB